LPQHSSQRPKRAVTAVVAEEYVQAIPSERRGRRMKSELIMIAESANGWVEFRDVFEVDGKPVRDRDQRIVNLFMRPTNGAIAQGRRIADESARFNISPLRLMESYQISGSTPGPAIDGAARYSNFRQFEVETDITIK
jgi:hypothetical protein